VSELAPPTWCVATAASWRPCSRAGWCLLKFVQFLVKSLTDTLRAFLPAHEARLKNCERAFDATYSGISCYISTHVCVHVWLSLQPSACIIATHLMMLTTIAEQRESRLAVHAPEHMLLNTLWCCSAANYL